MQHVCTCMWVCVCVQIDGYILVPSLMCSRSVISVRQIFAEWLTSLMHHSMTWVFNQDCIAYKKRNRPRDSGIMASLQYLRRLKQTDTHTPPFAREHFYTQTLLHTDRNFYTQTLLHTDTLTQKPFDTQKLRHTDPIYTQTLLHTNAYTLTLTPFYIQHQLNRNFTSVFAHRASFRAKGLLRHK